MITKKFVDFVYDLEYESLTEDVIGYAKKTLLDSLGCMLGGSQTSIGKVFIDFAKENPAEGRATVIGDGYKTSILFAPFVNSALNNILDFDDTSIGHTASTVIPAAISAAESVIANGPDLITSIVVGYEVANRVCFFFQSKIPKIVGKSINIWDNTTLQTYGAVAAASKLLGLDKNEMMNAFGISSTTAPSPGTPSFAKKREIGGHRSTIKASYGWSSMMGVLAAIMAKRGLTAVSNTFDGNLGFWCISKQRKLGFLDDITDELGKKYTITQIGFKPYPCCRHIHSSLDATSILMKEKNIEAEDVESVTIKTRSLLTDEHHDIRRPQSMTDAQFSVPYCVATMMVHGELTPDLFEDEDIKNPRTLEMIDRIKIVADDRFEKTKYTSCELNIQTSDGTTFSRTIMNPRGSTENPMSDQELKNKFRYLSSNAVSPDKAEKIIKIVDALEELEDISSLTKLLSDNI